MKLTRRQALGLSAGAFVIAATGIRPALADKPEVDGLIAKFTGGATVSEGRVSLTTPEIAENGNTVPIGVEVESPMSGADYVESVIIFAEGNPNPEVVTFHFTAASGLARAKTRIRLAGTQNVVAVAKMSDGSFFTASNQVKVTIGGCGG